MGVGVGQFAPRTLQQGILVRVCRFFAGLLSADHWRHVLHCASDCKPGPLGMSLPMHVLNQWRSAVAFECSGCRCQLHFLDVFVRLPPCFPLLHLSQPKSSSQTPLSEISECARPALLLQLASKL